MNMGQSRAKSPGFLARLRRDEAGNVIALAAAAVLPFIAIVGGAIDISRMYAVKTRMQAACDAGALSGRKVMGSAAWNSAADSAATQMFSANFSDNFFGSDSLTKNFSGADETVTGEISANVPMTLMRIFGTAESTISVTCTSEMRIPHTDVMFVLDNTGSMNCSPSDTIATCSNNGGTEKSDARIKGLRKATNCFYETLAREDTGEVCDAVNGDPTPTGLAADIQLRVGFLPYSSNINVGNILPTQYFANAWTYQSRVPVTSNIPVWNDSDSESFGPWDNPSRPNSGAWNTASNYSSFANVSGSGSVSIYRAGMANATVNIVVTGATSSNCANNNTIDSNRLRIVSDVAGSPSNSTPGASTAPSFGPPQSTNRTRLHTRTTVHNVVGYRYAWTSGECRLQSAAGKTSNADTRWTQTQSRTGTIPVEWTTVRELTGWTLRPRSVDISGLKNGTNWNSSLSVPDLGFSTVSVNRSGNNSSSNIFIPSSVNVGWQGCIEERQTFLNTDTNPDDDWDSIPGSALDMNIDAAPSTGIETQWAPALQGLIYSRLDNSGNRTMAGTLGGSYPVTSANNTNRKLNALTCPAEAKKLQVWANGTDIFAETNKFIATGGTYHDIGLLWGARLVSPTGIFASENNNDAAGNPITIQRHLVFMTDGEAGSCSSAYTPYGTAWWDRRQTNKDNPIDDSGVSTCTNSYTNRIIYARMDALCRAIKNKNITLWVVSFSAGVATTAKPKLEACASSNKHFYDADSTADLLTAFKEIALQISRLRLQS